MIQVSKILSELYGTGKSVVGFRQPINPAYAILSSPNTVCLSGVYLSSGIVTIENIKNCQEYRDISTTNFNTQLAQFIQDAIIDFCNLVFTADEKIESGLLFEKENKITETLDNDGDFVGFEIKTTDCKTLTSILTNLICEFNASGTLTVYLFHSSQQSSIQNQPVTLTENNAVKTFVNWALDLKKEYGGKYIIGYLTNGLNPKAINREWDESRQTQYFNLSIRPIIIENHTDTTLPNIDNIVYTSNTYGLNFDFSTFRDYTDYIIDNKNRFAEGIKLQFHANMLKMMLTSNQSNAIELNIKNTARLELEGILTESAVYSQGVLRKLENEAKKVRGEFFKSDMIGIGSLL